jgi:MFS family permease
MRLPALQSRSFCLYEGGSLFALNGQWITRIVVGWVGWELTGSATWVGLLSFFLFAPTIVTSPFFGVLVDRVHLKPTVIVSQGIVTLATLSLYILHLAGLLNIWSLSAVSLVIGIAGSAERAVRVTIVPRMVPLAALTNAVAIHATNFNVARLLGPAIGGILIERIGSGPTMLINFIVLVPFMVAVPFLKAAEKDGSKAERKSFLADFWSGAKVAARHPVIREAMALTCITSITVRGVLEILPALADGEFHRGAEGLGQMVAASGAGALVSAVVVAIRHTRKRPGIPLIGHVAVFVGTVSVAALGVAHTWPLAMLFVTLCGFAGTMIGINMQTTIQLTVDDNFRGRVMSLWMVAGIGLSALGALVLGFFADLFGLAETLIVGGIASALLSLAFRFFNAPSIARLERKPAE